MMRMIGIGLMGFILAGFALLLSSLNAIETGQRYVRELVHGPQLVFEDRNAVQVLDAHTVMVQHATPTQSIILSGLPAYQSVTFNMPMDARPTSGYLQIDATSQVLNGVEGVLRISIGNERRGEMLLHPGEAGRSLQVELSPTDFARDQLVVSFSVQGEGSTPQCPTSEGFEVIVEIETTSALHLTLDRPLETPRDKVRTWGQQAQIAWPNALPRAQRLDRLTYAIDFKRHGLESLFISAPRPEALTSIEMQSLLPQIIAANDGSQQAIWPRSIAAKGTNSGLRRFYRSTQWRVRYEVQNDATLSLPTQLDMQMILGRNLNREHWSLIVSLNNRLVHQSLIDPDQSSFGATIALPPEIHTAFNIIEITLSSTHSREGHCDLGPELIAELLPSSQLIAGAAMYSDEISELRHVLSQTSALRLWTAEQMTAADAQIATHMIAQILPQSAAIETASETAHIMIVSSQSAAPTFVHSEDIWIITQNLETRSLNVQRFEHMSQIQNTSLALLVSAQAMPIAQVKL
jgi:hypothetical protein